MTKAFKTSRLFGLLALLAGLMAFSATAAQAEPGAYWEVGGTQIKDKTLLPSFNIRNDSPHIILLSKSGLATLEIDCTEFELFFGLLHELGRATGSIEFNGCITRLAGSEAPLCKPHSPATPEETIITESLEGLLKLHKPAAGGTEDVLELKPVNAAGPFVKLNLGSGKCAIKGADLTGVIFLKDCKGLGLTNEREHLFEEFKALTKLLYGANPATIDGSAWAFLTGAHAGELWSGHPA
ncbi:MAG TPA: hypothetical protein VK513_15370 [Terriglobales bacterium]|nr:hypothetical protein [Terriglobales bacterium]